MSAEGDGGGIGAGDEGFRGVGEERRELRRVEFGLNGEQRFERRSPRGGRLQDCLQRVADAGLIGELREAQDFLLLRRTRELREQLGHARRAGLRFQRKRGEQAGFDGQVFPRVGIEELRDGIGMPFEEHPHEVTLELAVVCFADFDRFAVAGAWGGGLGERRLE